ncbi:MULTISPECIES: MAPEG family protein [unclassified Mesorhizobium]|uniref:MAPEG family protein n=1 Tax=unclassified Mesorhizobium TaxID=325217 RepID=UPI00333C2D52
MGRIHSFGCHFPLRLTTAGKHNEHADAGNVGGRIGAGAGSSSAVGCQSASALETFPVFVAGVLLVHALGRESGLSEWGASLYFSVRLVYLPPYAAGVPLFRSLVWNVAFVGIVLLLPASLWPEL